MEKYKKLIEKQRELTDQDLLSNEEIEKEFPIIPNDNRDYEASLHNARNHGARYGAKWYREHIKTFKK